jgi:20S proteasome alpha/beta subunit
MTCVAGIAREGRVYIGADSCASSNHSWQEASGAQKLFIVGGRFLIGVCGSFRLMDLLRYSLEVEPQADQDDDAYMRTKFISAVRSLLRDHGFLSKENQRESGGQFLVGYKGALYEVQPDFSVLNCPVWGHAIGTGELSARGSLYSTRKDWDARGRIQLALDAAEAITPSVRGPFTLLEI